MIFQVYARPNRHTKFLPWGDRCTLENAEGRRDRILSWLGHAPHLTEPEVLIMPGNLKPRDYTIEEVSDVVSLRRL